MTKLLLKQCYYISVRDENSFNLLKKWDIPSEIVPDPVYSLCIDNIEKNGNIGIQLRSFRTMNKNLLQKLALFVNSKFADRKVEIFSLQNEFDYNVCKAFEQILLSVNSEIKTEIMSENIINNIKNLDYFIGMRFHSLLIALKSGTKTCAINYDIKVEQLAKEMNIPLISMNAEENFEDIYLKLQNENPQNILQIVNSKIFDWSNLDRILNND
jgi:polysaccharide pyruvyl transferase WcaK-like protein